MMPRRIQRRRTKGWRMPAGAVYVGRPGRCGNPFVVGRHEEDVFVASPEQALTMFCDMLADPALRADYGYPSDEAIKASLTGKDLACWCPLDRPCHADVLLQLANAADPCD